MQLSARLEALIALTPEGQCVGDIGTDHGFVAVELVRRGKFARAIASDLRRGPLRAAAEHVAEAGLSDRIALRLGDGLSPLAPGEADVLFIAGMSGALMEKILTEGLAVAGAARYLVLSPQSEQARFRESLMALGFVIRREALVEEDGKFYPLLLAEPGREEEPWTPEELRYGRYLLRDNPMELQSLLERDVRILEQVLEAMEASVSPESRERSREKRLELEAARRLLVQAEQRKEEEMRRFFNRLAPGWDAAQCIDPQSLEQILEASRIREGCRVLDVACGTGVLIPEYLQRGAASVLGVDLAEEMLKLAEEKFAGNDKLSFLAGNAETLSYPGEYDLIMIFNAFPHFVHPDRLLTKLSACLAPGGRLCLAHSMGRQALEAHHRGLARNVSRSFPEWEALLELWDRTLTREDTELTDRMILLTGEKKPAD